MPTMIFARSVTATVRLRRAAADHLPRRLAVGALTLALTACSDPGGSAVDAESRQAETVLSDAVTAAGGKAALRMPASDDFGAIPQDPRNPLTREKVELGRLLFHDPSLGNQPAMADTHGTYSCASCHHARFGFQGGVAQAIGEGGSGIFERKLAARADPMAVDVQPVRTPSAMNVAWQRNILWNGQFGAVAMNAGTESRWTAGTPKAVNALGYHGLETQAIAGQTVHRLGAAPRVYQPMFDIVFADWPVERRYGAEAAGLAIAAYERTLMASEAPFQRWLRGDTWAMTPAQKRGGTLFLGKAGCAECHQGPALASESFHALGMPDLRGLRVDVASQPDHKGRGGFTGDASELYRFKTPQLYNLADSPFLGHGGSFRSVREVIEYKNLGRAANPNVPLVNLSPSLRPLALSAAEIDDLVAFVEQGLRDPDLLRYEPISLPSAVCKISADPKSEDELRFVPALPGA